MLQAPVGLVLAWNATEGVQQPLSLPQPPPSPAPLLHRVVHPPPYSQSDRPKSQICRQHPLLKILPWSHTSSRIMIKLLHKASGSSPALTLADLPVLVNHALTFGPRFMEPSHTCLLLYLLLYNVHLPSLISYCPPDLLCGLANS